MKEILKVYGMPRTGTNLLQCLLTINFKAYVCDLGEHHTHYLGWKHGVPPSEIILEYIKKYTNEQPYFIFTNRNYDCWSESVKLKHQNTFEFLPRLANKDIWFYNTPMGLEVYKDDLDFYTQRQKIYTDFCEQNPDISIMINFEDLQASQKGAVNKIKNKFNLELCNEFITPIKKQINSSGQLVDFIEK